MNDATAEPLREPPVAGNEVDTLLGSLERQRRTFAWKTGGLDAAGLNTKIAKSTMSLGGLLKHLALVEDDWFSYKLWGHERATPWNRADWDSDPDWDWHSAAQDPPEHLYRLWDEAVARSRALVAQALDDGLDRPAQFVWSDGRSPSLRRMLADMIEEYARHVGHADLLREAVDGVVGEDPPQP